MGIMGIMGYLPLILITLDIALLVAAFATKKRDFWNLLITVNVVSIISAVLTPFAGAFNSGSSFDSTALFISGLFLGIIVMPTYIVILVVNIVLKAKFCPDPTHEKNPQPSTPVNATEAKNNAYINGYTETNQPSEPATVPTAKKSSPIMPLAVGVFMIVAIIAGFYFTGEYNKRGTLESYASVKAKEIKAMADYLNAKYGLNVSSQDVIYYLERDTNKYHTYGLSYETADIPYYAIFKVGSEEIAVADRDNRLSDNRQLKEIDKLIVDYFEDNTGISFNYINFSLPNSDIAIPCIEYNAINKILQTEMSDLLTKNNIDLLDQKLLNIDRLKINFYIKDSVKVYPYEVAEHLSFLQDYTNIDELTIWFYDNGDISYIIYDNLDKTDYEKTEKSWDKGTYVKDSYKFGCTYVEADEDKDIRFLTAKPSVSSEKYGLDWTQYRR